MPVNCILQEQNVVFYIYLCFLVYHWYLTHYLLAWQVLPRSVPAHPRGRPGYSQGDEDGRHHRLRPQHRQQEEERRQVQSKAVQRKGE